LAKNIVICSDGTWNTAFKNRGTNVFKLFEAVDVNGHKIDPNVTPQIAFYDDGVGTGGGRLWKLLGGAFGFGLARNVRQLYTELARTYVPGDHLYFFGFSRGAFTVRTLVGLIDLCGIPDRSKVRSDGELRKLVRKAYGVYRWKYAAWLQRAVDAMLKMSAGLSLRRAAPWWEVRAASHPGAPRVPFVGVWDTVDAIGLPVAGAAHLLNTLVFRFKFPNRTLTAIVDRACQALSIDDQRKTFHPILWDASGEDGARIEQVWFAGVHANVGGGYPKQGMSLVALDWMMTNGGSAGLRFAPGAPDGYRQRRNVNDKIYDSRAGPASFYRYMPRDISVLCRTNGVVPRIHVSALERIVQGTEGYAPGNIPGKLQRGAVGHDRASARGIGEPPRQGTMARPDEALVPPRAPRSRGRACCYRGAGSERGCRGLRSQIARGLADTRRGVRAGGQDRAPERFRCHWSRARCRVLRPDRGEDAIGDEPDPLGVLVQSEARPREGYGLHAETLTGTGLPALGEPPAHGAGQTEQLLSTSLTAEAPHSPPTPIVPVYFVVGR
jgi:uncharacterized protein (DUF2235 family)